MGTILAQLGCENLWLILTAQFFAVSPMSCATGNHVDCERIYAVSRVSIVVFQCEHLCMPRWTNEIT